MTREIFRKVPLSEKKQMFRDGAISKMQAFVKGDGDELITLYLDEFVDEKVLIFHYMPQSAKLLGSQVVILNFSYGEDRYFLHTQADIVNDRVHIDADVDVYVLQRRKTPRLEIPANYPARFNIIQHKDKTVFYECGLEDFSSGGCKAVYKADLPSFHAGDKLRGVLHLSHRNPLELDCEIKHHFRAAGGQVFGLQFKLPTTILENRMLVLFMDLQRELFTKWSGLE